MFIALFIKNRIFNKSFLGFLLSWRFLVFVFILLSIIFLLKKPRGLDRENSYQFYSKEGYLLKEYNSEKEDYSEKIKLEEIPEVFQTIILVAEDKRFYYHPGFDLIAMFRSLFKNIISFRIVSGASTITQQLVKIIYQTEFPKNIILKKAFEIIYSFKLELYYSKKEILEAYLNQISIRHNYTGISSSSKYLFQRSLNFLSKEEMISITILIRENQTNPQKFRIRFLNLWEKVFQDEKYNTEVLDKIEKLIFSKNNNPTKEHLASRHFTDWIHKFSKINSGKIYTNISANQNEIINHILNSELKLMELNFVNNGAVVILKLPNQENNFQLELISMLGSKNFNEPKIGQINGAIRIRQAGSTLKPFLYGLAFDKKLLKPNSILQDEEIKLINDKNEVFIPRNNDLNFWGNLTVRESLANSRNIPAFKTYQMVGGEEFLKLLINLDFDHLDKSAEYYGPSLALGTGGASLLQLAIAYSVIANQGKLFKLKIGSDESGKPITLGKEKRIFSDETCFYLKSILSDTELRKRGYGKKNYFNFPFLGVAIKTGTSKDYKDAWAIGFTTEYVVGVWVGNFQGNPMNKISGGYGAGKIFHQIIRLLHHNSQKDFSYPQNFKKKKYCKFTGLKANKNCPEYLELINTDNESSSLCNGIHDQINSTLEQKMIKSPIHLESFIIDPNLAMERQAIPIIIKNINSKYDEEFYSFSIDGKDKIEIKSDIKKSLVPIRGVHKITLFKKNKIIEEVEFMVE